MQSSIPDPVPQPVPDVALGGIVTQLSLRVHQWQERRAMAAAARALLRAYQRLMTAQPAVTPVQRYQQLVQQHCACTAAEAEQVVVSAFESYAQWPHPRQVCLRDVIHYLAVTGFLLGHPGTLGVCADVTEVVDGIVAVEL